MGRLLPRRPAPNEPPILHLSGPRLTAAFEALIEGAEERGGIEPLVGEVAFKAALFSRRLGDGRAAGITEESFLELLAFIAPARRRLGAWLANHDFAELAASLTRLLARDMAADPASVDARINAFAALFPADSEHRWTCDLGAELLHFTDPEGVPLMTRWVWDAGTNTGVLREIWHGGDLQPTIEVADTCATFRVLFEELAGFLRENGVFRDIPLYVDLLCAQVYGEYVSAQGDAYLRTDFTAPNEPLLHTRRMLGLDPIGPVTGRARRKRAGAGG